MTPARRFAIDRNCCYDYKYRGKTSENCKSVLSDPQKCAAVFAKMDEIRSNAAAARVRRERFDILSNGIGILSVLALIFLMIRKRRKSAPRVQSPPQAKVRPKPPGPKINRGSYE